MAGPARTRTRGRFVDTWLRAVGPQTKRATQDAQKHAIRCWNRWTPQVREELIEHLDALSRATEARDHASEAAVESELPVADARRLGLSQELVPRCQRTYQEHVHLQNAQQVVQTETIWLHSFYQEEGCLQAVVDLAAQLLRQEQAQRAAIDDQVEHWAGEAAAPPPAPRKQLVEEYRHTVGGEFRLHKFHAEGRRDKYSINNLEPPQQGHRWQGPYGLCHQHSGDTLITIWVLIDDDGVVQDCRVRKDIDYSFLYNLLQSWDGDARDIVNRRTNEIACHEAMSQIQTSTLPRDSNVLRLIHHGFDDIEIISTIYTELATHGTLGDYIKSCVETETFVPEAFIWYCFWALTECGLAMQYGRVTDSVDLAENEIEVAEPGWHEIVHRDLKPLNVFLCAANPDHFPDYPAPKLGDFGVSLRTTQDDLGNPHMYTGGEGTAGWKAPEQDEWHDERTHQPVDRYKLGAHTNVYSVGLIIWAMVMGQDARNNLARDGTFVDIWREDDANRRGHYSDSLIDLIDECVRFRPEERTTFRELHRAITHVFDDTKSDTVRLQTVRNIRNGTADPRTLHRNAVFALPESRNHSGPVRTGDERFRKGTQFINNDGSMGRSVRSLQLLREDVEMMGKIGYEESWL